MVLFICILKDYRKVEALLLGLLESGVTGATCLEGRGMGQIVGGEVPIFASLRGLFPGSASDSHVVFAVIPAEDEARCFDLTERVAGPMDDLGAGVAFSVPVGRAMGLAKEIL